MRYGRRYGRLGLVAAMAVAIGASSARASVLDVTGAGISGDYTISGAQSVWSLVGGVTTSTPAGDNGKNAILRYYVIATGSGGAESVFSLGELDPAFGGTNTAPYVTVSGGHLSLVDPNAGASGRGVADLTSLQVFAAPALPLKTGAGASTGVNLSGPVTAPGTYTAAQLATLPSTTLPTSGHTYTGTSLFSFISPLDGASTRAIVVTSGTDGYEVVLSLAELNPALGGNAANLLAYGDTGGDFPGDGVARTIFPTDNKHGRWMSNLDAISVQEVAAVPEASTWCMAIAGFAIVGFAAGRRRRASMAQRAPAAP